MAKKDTGWRMIGGHPIHIGSKGGKGSIKNGGSSGASAANAHATPSKPKLVSKSVAGNQPHLTALGRPERYPGEGVFALLGGMRGGKGRVRRGRAGYGG